MVMIVLHFECMKYPKMQTIYLGIDFVVPVIFKHLPFKEDNGTLKTNHDSLGITYQLN